MTVYEKKTQYMMEDSWNGCTRLEYGARTTAPMITTTPLFTDAARETLGELVDSSYFFII